MKNLLNKEIKLSASKLTFLFILFGLMTLLPGYPILVGAFFISFGIFHSFQAGRENGDILYSVLLPTAKADVVKSKFAFCIFIEACAFVLMTVLTFCRMTVLSDAFVYRTNAMMNANLVFLAFALLIFGIFNLIFVGGFFKTAYDYGKPFIRFIIIAFLVITVAETLHHLPGMEAINAFGFDSIVLQLIIFSIGLMCYIIMTRTAIKRSVDRFDKIDL